ncbi:methylated-DNA--[protein]-cysteine S-methyltransferase [Glaciecola siphonariae]|uniref:Methylated-DNA--protein-cysteine methyltransferase n=1 Tax=Glaciecola siphonariae TaxID=521012 RepID=A0ABV9LQV7_9ALTE
MSKQAKSAEQEQQQKQEYRTVGISQFATPVGYVQVRASERAVLSVAFADDAVQEQANDISEHAKGQLIEYFAGARSTFDIPLSPKGTQFQQQVWNALQQIAYGEVASYLDIAQAVGNVKACRAVGAANGKNPIAIIVPCHRIIGSNGKLTGYAGGMSRKAFLLSLESNQQRLFIENI